MSREKGRRESGKRKGVSREKDRRESGKRRARYPERTMASVVGECSLPWHEALDQMLLALCFGPTCPLPHMRQRYVGLLYRTVMDRSLLNTDCDVQRI